MATQHARRDATRGRKADQRVVFCMGSLSCPIWGDIAAPDGVVAAREGILADNTLH